MSVRGTTLYVSWIPPALESGTLTLPAKTSYPDCPYGAEQCPKIEDIKEDAEDNRRRIQNIERILYMIVGMIAINWGISLW